LIAFEWEVGYGLILTGIATEVVAEISYKNAGVLITVTKGLLYISERTRENLVLGHKSCERFVYK